ncbi:CbrC family protein [Pseudomonas wadenswilerensis]
MIEKLPTFTYFPAPVAYLKESAEVCICCQRARGVLYEGSLYTEQETEGEVCPWCIADGSAAQRFNASFNSVDLMEEAGIAQSILDEVACRTPSYPAWQEEIWLHHCDDACEFHGDASAQDIASASAATREAWAADFDQDEADWATFTQNYQPGGDSCFYKFVCRHCQLVLFSWDLS